MNSKLRVLLLGGVVIGLLQLTLLCRDERWQLFVELMTTPQHMYSPFDNGAFLPAGGAGTDGSDLWWVVTADIWQWCVTFTRQPLTVISKQIQRMLSGSTHVITYSCRLMFWAPLMYLYMNGPALYGYGFWKGKDMVDICSELSTVPTRHWIANPQECHHVIFRHLESFVITSQLVFAGLVLMALLYLFWCDWFYNSMLESMFDRLDRSLRLRHIVENKRVPGLQDRKRSVSSLITSSSSASSFY
jgi:hypothetical protein